MEQEQIDPVYKYVDNKIKLIKRELQQLTVAHDTVTKQHEEKLLELQRIVAMLRVNSDVDFFISVIDNQLPKETTMRTQVIAEASVAKSKIETSSNPHHLMAEFYNKWGAILHAKGVDFITY